VKLFKIINYSFMLYFLVIYLIFLSGCAGQSLTTREILMSPEQELINYALASNGGSAESTDNNPDHPPSNVIDGDTSSLNWDNGGGWEGGLSRYRLQDLLKLSYVQVNLPSHKQVKQIVVYTLDSPKYPASEFGLRTYRLEYWHGTGWGKVRTPGSLYESIFAIKNNKEGKIIHKVDEELITDKIRLVPIYSNDINRTYNLTAYAGKSFYNVEGAARVVEIEVWCSPGTPGVATSEEPLFPPGKAQPSPDEQAINKILSDYEQGYDNENLEQVMSTFSEDFKTLEGKSRKDIEEKTAKIFKEYSNINITLRDLKVNITPSADMATVNVNYTLDCVAEADKNSYRTSGTLVFSFRKENGTDWKITSAE
jgi:ketosteroid isomerase-like protein